MDRKECFVIMPITDRDPYDPGHFQIVYEHLIKPACLKAGFSPIRADDVKNTNFIVKDILTRLLNSPMAICDLSGQNPNVLFELGIRQAFNKPVTLIKDAITPRIFDIDGLRCLDYYESLRIDLITPSIDSIAEMLKNTYESNENLENSLIHSLSIKPASLLNEQRLTSDTTVLLQSINSLKDQVELIKNTIGRHPALQGKATLTELTADEMVILDIPRQKTLDGGSTHWFRSSDGYLYRTVLHPEKVIL